MCDSFTQCVQYMCLLLILLAGTDDHASIEYTQLYCSVLSRVFLEWVSPQPSLSTRRLTFRQSLRELKQVSAITRMVIQSTAVHTAVSLLHTCVCVCVCACDLPD